MEPFLSQLLQQKPQQCGAIKELNLFNKYLLLVTFETDDNYSIRFEMNKNTIRTALFSKTRSMPSRKRAKSVPL